MNLSGESLGFAVDSGAKIRGAGFAARFKVGFAAGFAIKIHAPRTATRIH